MDSMTNVRLRRAWRESENGFTVQEVPRGKRPHLHEF
jgi:hypothetical protein